MELNALNLSLVLGILLVLLGILALVVCVVCKQQNDGIFPQDLEAGKEESGSSSVKTLEAEDLDRNGDPRAPLPNLPKIIVTTASLRMKHI
ncbi:hypothetical protein M3Y99_01101500 [Aphelenchoides fujianensis]|nr:hypothetical protein M3Y99_01101500 [Aphelenchoides fujianensis]